MALVLDAGALIAFDRGERDVLALLAETRRRRERVVTSSGCVAQAWREGGPRQALLARLLKGVNERGLTPEVSRQIGELCAKASSSDVVDAHVALLAGDADVVVTSDPGDLLGLLRAGGSRAQALAC